LLLSFLLRHICDFHQSYQFPEKINETIVALVVKRPAALLRCQHRSFVALSGYKYYEMDEAPVC
jgi:hypothetical protein